MSEPESYWRGILDGALLRAHWRWYRRGKEGEGRIVMEGENLRGAAVASLQGARFVGCDLSRGHFELLHEVELIRCKLVEAKVPADFTKALLEDCDLSDALAPLAEFFDARITGGTWRRTNLDRSRWNGARVSNVDFRGANFANATVDDAEFVRCDFRGCRCERTERFPRLGTTRGTRFVQCDFRGANLSRRRLDGTVFDRCRFHGVIGTPTIEGPYTVIAPDFSADGDGSDVRDPEAVYRMWGEPGKGKSE